MSPPLVAQSIVTQHNVCRWKQLQQQQQRRLQEEHNMDQADEAEERADEGMDEEEVEEEQTQPQYPVTPSSSERCSPVVELIDEADPEASKNSFDILPRIQSALTAPLDRVIETPSLVICGASAVADSIGLGSFSTVGFKAGEHLGGYGPQLTSSTGPASRGASAGDAGWNATAISLGMRTSQGRPSAATLSSSSSSSWYMSITCDYCRKECTGDDVVDLGGEDVCLACAKILDVDEDVDDDDDDDDDNNEGFVQKRASTSSSRRPSKRKLKSVSDVDKEHGWCITCDSCSEDCTDDYVDVLGEDLCLVCAESLGDDEEEDNTASHASHKNKHAAGPAKKKPCSVVPPVPPFVQGLVAKASEHIRSEGADAIDNLVREMLPAIQAAKTDDAKVAATQELLFGVLALLLGKTVSPAFKNECEQGLSFLDKTAILPFVQQETENLVLVLMRVAKVAVHVNDFSGKGGWTAETARALAAFISTFGAKLVCFNVGVGYSESTDLLGLGGNITYKVSAPERKFGVNMLGILLSVAASLGKTIVLTAHTLGNNNLKLDFCFMRKEATRALKSSERLPAHASTSGKTSTLKDLQTSSSFPGTLHPSMAGLGPGKDKAAGPMTIAVAAAKALHRAPGLSLKAAVDNASEAAVDSLESFDTPSSRIVQTVMGKKAAHFVLTGPKTASDRITEQVAQGLIDSCPDADEVYQQLLHMQKKYAVPAETPLPANLPEKLGRFKMTIERCELGDILQEIEASGGEAAVPARNTLEPKAQVANLVKDLRRKKKTMKPLWEVEVWLYLVVVRDKTGTIIDIYVGSTCNLLRRFAVDRPKHLLKAASGDDDALVAFVRRRQKVADTSDTLHALVCSWKVPEGVFPLGGGGNVLMLFSETVSLSKLIPRKRCLNKRQCALTLSGGFDSEDAKAAG